MRLVFIKVTGSGWCAELPCGRRGDSAAQKVRFGQVRGVVRPVGVQWRIARMLCAVPCLCRLLSSILINQPSSQTQCNVRLYLPVMRVAFMKRL